ncbi:MAG: hypothetical protein MJA29_10225 [Candidatus Omnitrophica bacterium]|nr:hypothetical protein [Candidatus Omnitrophota bacterium]
MKLSPGVILRRVRRDLVYHAVGTFVLAAAIYLHTRDSGCVALVVLGGILIDVDHFIDYALVFKSKFHLRKFLLSDYLKSGKIYIILHSWELIILLGAVSLLTDSYGLFLLSLSMAMHLGIDSIQRMNPLLYFLVVRILRRFDASVLVPEYGDEYYAERTKHAV